MDHPTHLGFWHFLAQADAVIHTILGILIGMSLVSWYLVVLKSLTLWRIRHNARRFLPRFWDAPDLASVPSLLEQQPSWDPFSAVVRHALQVISAWQQRNELASRLAERCDPGELLTRAIRRAIEQSTVRLEYGQTVLASIASTAPFIGLFGTVWGIYHALLAIGFSGQASLDRVAGPVGEALVMTAIGLAVAVPAVLAYNAFARQNRLLLAELDGFAHDVFALLAIGSDTGCGAAVTSCAARTTTANSDAGSAHFSTPSPAWQGA